MNKLSPGQPGDLTRRLFQISEALSLEERNLRNNPSGLSRAADFIEEFFSRTGFGVSRQTFRIDGFDCHNLEAVPRDFCGFQEPHWILGPHYDSAPGTLGADDNISAVGVFFFPLAQPVVESAPRASKSSSPKPARRPSKTSSLRHKKPHPSPRNASPPVKAASPKKASRSWTNAESPTNSTRPASPKTSRS